MQNMGNIFTSDYAQCTCLLCRVACLLGAGRSCDCVASLHIKMAFSILASAYFFFISAFYLSFNTTFMAHVQFHMLRTDTLRSAFVVNPEKAKPVILRYWDTV